MQLEDEFCGNIGERSPEWKAALAHAQEEDELVHPSAKARYRQEQLDQETMQRLDNLITPAKKRRAEADKAVLMRSILEHIRQTGSPENMAALIARLAAEGCTMRATGKGAQPYSETAIRAVMHRLGIEGQPGRKRSREKAP